MDLSDIFSDITRRVPNAIIGSRFNQQGNIVVDTTAEKTLAKIKGIIREGDSEQLESLNKVAKWYVDDFRLHGEKATYFFKISPDVACFVIKALRELEVQENLLSAAYPSTLKVDDETSGNPEYQKYHLMDVEDYDDGIAITLSAFRFYSEQVELKPSDLSTTAKSKYSDIDKFVGTKKRFSQFFDIVVIWPDGSIELRVDNPQKDGIKPLPFTERKGAYLKLKTKVGRMVSDLLGQPWELPDPFNLIHVVDNIYRETREGYVKELRFITTNSNAKSSKANWKDIDDCCRADVFIKAGTEGVKGKIFPYRLEVHWPTRPEIYPSLQIFGTVYCVDSGNSIISEAIVKNCQTQADYKYVRDKVLRYYEQGLSEQLQKHITR